MLDIKFAETFSARKALIDANSDKGAIQWEFEVLRRDYVELKAHALRLEEQLKATMHTLADIRTRVNMVLG